MKTKIIKFVLPIFLLALSGIGFSQSEEKPNVVLIMLDDLNDFTGFLGGHPQVKTPNMDKLAKQGTVFTNAHSNAPICAPSRSSMLTGIYPHVSRNFWFFKWTKNEVLKDVKTLPNYMRENGYNSYGTGKLMHDRVVSEWTEYGVKNDFGPYPFNGKGYKNGKEFTPHPLMPIEYATNRNDGLFMSLDKVPNVPADANSPGYNGWYNLAERKHFKYNSEDDRDLMNDELHAQWAVNKIESLEKNNTDKPFFLAVGFVRPHTPLVAPKKYFDMYPVDKIQLPKIKKNDTDDTYYRETFTWDVPWGKHYQNLEKAYKGDINYGLRKYLQAYLACITYADEQVGKVLDALEKSKFSKNTIIILASDHGYNHGEKGFLYKNNLWEETTRVPLVIKAPNMKKSHGKTIDNPVSLIDIFPTITDFCDINVSNIKGKNGKPLSGFSLKPFLEKPKSSKWNGPDVALSVVRGFFKNSEIDKQNYSVRSKRYRYILYTSGKEELYDHKKDPHEWTNLAKNKKYSKIKKDMRSKMMDLLNQS
ncbi:sulfatase [Polaribacter sp. Z022]|uniref:sulfatase n=1 Tax=Polaribacter sp. Z022 TaxID=2927125 RepID=UPI002021D917|nr:sulfatase [Polaribacter sp. Z022]MCL7752987.1 sulfatase [Polaribacter sp. Z022]